MLIRLMCLFCVIFFNYGGVMGLENLSQSFSEYRQIKIINNGQELVLEKGNDKAEVVMDALREVAVGSHEMPALGVSIDHLTREEMNSGLWLEIEFDTAYKYNGMPFESLLINVEKGMGGVNIIRKCNGKYDGRCFYLSLNSSMDLLYDKMISVL